MSKLTGREIVDAGLVDWSFLHDGLQTRLVTKDFTTGLRLVDRIGAAAEAANHHPDLDCATRTSTSGSPAPTPEA